MVIGEARERMIQSLGRYEILSELGRGAMGIVYLAKDPKIDRTVAIKSLHPGLFEQDKTAKDRFQQEVHALGRLIHQNIVSIFDTGEDPKTGNPYIVTEYVAGMSLAERLKEGPPLSIEQACRIGAQLCSALDFAHEKRIVHRDIKPGNILVSPDLQTVKLTDFGIARLEGGGVTQTGQLVGTPRYMSPEQCRAEAIDGRSDLFSVGAVLYEMVTGQKAFPANEVTAALLQVMKDTPLAPTSVSQEVPQALSDVIMKALQKSPLDRFMSGKEMAEVILTQASVSPVPYSPTVNHPIQVETTWVPPPEVAANNREGRWIKPVVAMGVVLMVAGWGGWKWYDAQPRPTPPFEERIGEEKTTSPPAQEAPNRAIVTGALNLSTTPDGAKVVIDGKEYGMTPLTVELPAGSHDLEVAKPGYHLLEATLEVVSNETIPMDLTLTKEEEKR
jgi:serine/threonine-protein kinase